MSGNRGGALVEFSVVMVAFVPLVVGLPMIGKIIDLDQTAIQASRYVAWESTVRPPGHSPTDLEARFFSESSALVSNTPDLNLRRARNATDTGVGSGLTPERTAHVPDTRVAIVDGSITALRASSIYADDQTTGSSSLPTGVAHAMGTSITQVAETMADATGGDWNFRGDGLLRSGVHIAIESNDWLSRSRIDETSVIMSDEWNVGNDASAAKRARTFVPGGVLDKMGIGDMISMLGYIPAFTELRSFEDALGHVETGVLPPSETARRVLRPYSTDDR